MAEEIKNVNAKIDEAEAAVKKYASKDTVISIGGYEFTPAKLMVAATIVSSILGGLYGTFEVYKDYIGMKKKIASYEAPDLSGFDKRLAVIEENSQKTSDYTRDIKIDLKNDVRRLDDVVSDVERTAKSSQRETDNSVRDLRTEVRSIRGDMEVTLKSNNRELQSTVSELKRENQALERKLENKIKQALDNPLANK